VNDPIPAGHQVGLNLNNYIVNIYIL
jgi:hypothetical protein